MFTTTTTARARVSTFTASEEYDRKMSSSAYAQRRRNCHNRGRYFVRTSSFGYYYSRNEERRRRSLSGLMLATTSEPNADGNNSNDGRLVMIRKKNLRILRTGRLSSLRRMNSTALDGKSSSPSSSSVDDVEDDEDEEDNSNNSIGEEEKTTTTKKKKTANEQQSSSSESVVLLATAAIASGLIAYKGGPEQSIEYVQSFVESFFVDLIKNHSEGVGGIIEDVYLSTLFLGTVYALWRSSAVPRPIGNPIQRKSRTFASTVHVFSGAGALAVALYAVVLERVFRESPGWSWMWVTSSLFLVNSLSYEPLMKIFKASKEGKYAMKLGYSFVASFQGVVWIAWSAQPDAPDWMFWAVMPFWYFSIAKLWESTEFCLALVPEVPKTTSEKELTIGNKINKFITSGSRQRLGKMSPDAATLTYVGLNAAAAVFDNCYMAVYTYLGPEQFWHTSQAFNDSDFHLRLVKGTTGSLTVALLIFISTLGWRKQMPMKYAIWLNVALGSVGPWIVLFWHKLLDPSEMWFPQFVFDPAFSYESYIPSLFT